MTTLATKGLLWIYRLCFLLSLCIAVMSVGLHLATFFGRAFGWTWVLHLVVIGLAFPCVFIIAHDKNRVDWMWGAPPAVAVSFLSGIYFLLLGFYRHHVSAPPDTPLADLLGLRQFSIAWLAVSTALISSYSGIIKHYDQLLSFKGRS